MIQFIAHNQVTLLRDGTEYFPSLIQSILHAQDEIFLESYIFAEDKTGRKIAAALCIAARRGVLVHLLLDGFGSAALTKKILGTFKKARIRVLFFRPDLGNFSIKKNRLRRMHRKVALFDRQVAYVGGINIIQDAEVYFLPPRYDYAVRLQGPIVAHISKAVYHLWRHTCWVQLKFEWINRAVIRPILSKVSGQVQVGFAIRDNFRHRYAIEEAYLQAINKARQEIIIANAYFLPAKRFCDALIAAAKRGVNVHILLQGRTDHVIQYFASRTLYKKFLQQKIAIYEYVAGFMHVKVAIIDKTWSTVGSSNIDPFSLLLAREANVFIYDTKFSQHLRQDVLKTIQQDALTVHLTDLKKQPWLLRILPSICYQFMRLVMGIIGYGKEEYK